MNPKVSIIIPTYKRSNNLKRAIRSAERQTYKNLEIIVVDDNDPGSKYREETEKIIKEFPSVTYIKNKKNSGGGVTRNNGIIAAHGDLISFLDDDDEYLPEKVEKQVKLYNKVKNNHNVGVIYCYKQSFNVDGTLANIEKSDFEGHQLFNHICFFTMTTSCWLCPKEALMNVGLFDDIRSQQDATLMLRLLGAGYEIFRVAEPLVNFYRHSYTDGITKVNQKYIDETIVYQNKCRLFFEKLTPHQQKIAEYHLGNRLCNLYIKNHDKKNALKVLKHMFKSNPIGIANYKNIIKVIIK